jgi:Flp pilus assembly pilin Flp
MRRTFASVWSDESGQGLTEYAVLLAMVSLGLIFLLTSYRNALGNLFKNATTKMNSVNPILQAS